MDQHYCTTDKRQKGKHLTKDERIIIQLRLKDGWSNRRIAKEIGCSPNTIGNEIRRGTVLLYTGNVKRYKADIGQQTYESHRLNSHRHYKLLEVEPFIHYVETQMRDFGWSLDACVGRAIHENKFTKQQRVCTKTLYNYIDIGLINMTNMDLPEKLKRNTKRHRNRQHKRILGRSIEKRPAEVETRETFGHWECDLIIGSKTGDDKALLTLAERKSRECLIFPIADKRPESVMAVFDKLRADYSDHFGDVFKTITTDNGLEFSALSDLEVVANTLVYYAHPYSSYEKATIERHNGLIRRFIPKGRRIDDYSLEQIANIELWCNSLPRKILGYQTPDEVFEAELDKIYHLAS